MYACILRTVAGFFSEVCALRDQRCISSDPPCHSWIASSLYCLRLTRFLRLTGVNVYSLLHYLVLGNKLQGGKIGHPPLPKGQAMQHPVCGLLRIPLPRTSVNKGKEKGRIPVGLDPSNPIHPRRLG
jgi:hypothetical protein